MSADEFDDDEWDDDDFDDEDDDWLYDEDTAYGKCKKCGRRMMLMDSEEPLCDDCELLAEQDKPARDEEVTELKDPPWLTWTEQANPVA